MSILTKGKFWAVLVAVVVFVIRYFMPNFPVADPDLANVLSASIAAILLLFGIVVDQEVAMRALRKKLGK